MPKGNIISRVDVVDRAGAAQIEMVLVEGV
jgi:hypothetical protein